MAGHIAIEGYYLDWSIKIKITISFQYVASHHGIDDVIMSVPLVVPFPN